MSPLFPKRSNDLYTQRRHQGNMRYIIGLAGGYILYDGIRLIRSQETTPTFFYVYLVVFTVFMIAAFILNMKRLQETDRKIAEEQARKALEESQQGTDDQSEANDWPDDLSQS